MERETGMTYTGTITPGPQRMRALERANEVRLARARLKRQIAGGQTSAAYVILELPWEARNWSVGELLMSQRRWGSTRARKLLNGLHISEKRPIGDLTERQRRLLASHLGVAEPRVAASTVAEPRVDLVDRPQQAPEVEIEEAPAHEFLAHKEPALALA
jgi:hypothetical protein